MRTRALLLQGKPVDERRREEPIAQDVLKRD